MDELENPENFNETEEVKEKPSNFNMETPLNETPDYSLEMIRTQSCYNLKQSKLRCNRAVGLDSIPEETCQQLEGILKQEKVDDSMNVATSMTGLKKSAKRKASLDCRRSARIKRIKSSAGLEVAKRKKSDRLSKIKRMRYLKTSTRNRRSLRVIRVDASKLCESVTLLEPALETITISSTESDFGPTKENKSLKSLKHNEKEKSKRSLRFNVSFLEEKEDLIEIVKNLGGGIVENVEDCNVLIARKIQQKSLKLLKAIGQKKFICSPKWLRVSNKKGSFENPSEYILQDKRVEAKLQFTLKDSLKRASKRKLFKNMTFLLLNRNTSGLLKETVKSCGGKCYTRTPSKQAKFYAVCELSNSYKCDRIIKNFPNVKIVHPEEVFVSALRQDLVFQRQLNS